MGATLRRTVLSLFAIAVLGLAVGSASAQAPADPAAGALDETSDGLAEATGDGAATAPDERAAPGDGDETAPEGPGVRDAEVKIRIGGLKGGRLTVGNRFKVKGTLRPFVKGERVTVVVKRGKKTIKRKTLTPKQKPGSNLGKFKFARKQISPGRYSVAAVHKRSDKLAFARDKSKPFRIRYPSLREGNRSSKVKIFNNLLKRRGYVPGGGKKYNAATGRAVLAFRKVNKMAWNTRATSRIFKKLAKGKGGYRLKHPGSGKHVEIDLSRQVMVLAKGKKVKEIYHVSTGAPATPTPPGTWRFYRKDAGFNSIGMYYSVYWNRGYATHGYKSVPNYPASHGCARNPIPDAKHIYNWIDIGDLIHIYR